MEANNTAGHIKQKNLNIECLRIIACLMVILMHIRPELLDESGQVMEAALLMQVLAAPGVGIFFLITGCFTPASSVKKTLKRFFSQIALPALLLAVSVNFLSGWIAGKTDIIASILQTNIGDVSERIIRGIIAFDANILDAPWGGLGHLWFIFSYAVILIWLPLLHVLVGANAKKPLTFFVILALLKLIVIDICQLWTLPFQIYFPVMPPVELLYVTAGWLIFSAIKEKIPKFRKIFVTGSFAAAVVIAFALFFLQKALYIKEIAAGADPTSARVTFYYLNWLSGIAVLYAMAIMTAALSLPSPPQRLRRIIEILGGATFPVYLLHFPIIAKLRTMGIEGAIRNPFSAMGGTGTVIYSAIYAVFVFLISLMFCGLIFLVLAGIKFLIKELERGISRGYPEKRNG